MTNDLVTFDPEQLDLIKRQLCPGITDEELKLFAMQCRRTGLDPFAKQVYAVKRYDQTTGTEKMAIQYAIDGFRVIAERNGKYAGQVGPFWCGPDGIWKDVWLSPEPPVAAKVGVLRADFKETLWGVAKYSTYVQRKKDGKVTRFWATMPEVMIAKCAESIALRRAFPQDLAGCYTSDEMGQADNDVPESRPAFPQGPNREPTPAPKAIDVAKVETPPAPKKVATWPVIAQQRRDADPEAAKLHQDLTTGGLKANELGKRDSFVKILEECAKHLNMAPGEYDGPLELYAEFIDLARARFNDLLEGRTLKPLISAAEAEAREVY